MSEKSDKLRAMLEKEKERRIKLNNRIPKYPHPCVIAHRFVKLG